MLSVCVGLHLPEEVSVTYYYVLPAFYAAPVCMQYAQVKFTLLHDIQFMSVYGLDMTILLLTEYCGSCTVPTSMVYDVLELLTG